MSFARAVVHRPVSVLMAFIVLAGLGAAALAVIPIDLFPSTERPVIAVFTDYEDAGPAEVEREITEPLEKELAGIGGLENITSISSEGSSRIILNFFVNADLTRASNDVRDVLGAIAGNLPEDASIPRMRRFNPDSMPIMNIALTGNLSSEELRRIAEDSVQSELEQVDGVGQADVRGGREMEVQVEVDRTAMESFGLTLTEIASRIRAQNADKAGGSIPQGGRRYLVRTVGSLSSVEEIGEVVVGYAKSEERLSAVGPRPIRLSEIATVRLQGAEETRVVLINGVPGVYIAILKESGANSVRVADEVRARMEKIQASLPAETELRILDDATTTIKASLNEVSKTLLTGGLLTLSVLFFFLRNVRAVLSIAVSIPVSLLAAGLAMSIGGLSLNSISLSGLILGIGMIVDSSIVVLENVSRRRGGGQDIESAAIIGTDEMIGAIAGSALTTICVFAPMYLFRRGLGDFSYIIGDIAFTVIASISASLVVAGTLVPALISTFLPLPTEEDRVRKLGIFRPVDAAIERLLRMLENGYARGIAFALSHRLAVIGSVVVAMAVAIAYAPRIPFIFAPPSAEDTVNLRLQMREGTLLETMRDAALQVADRVAAETPDALNLVLTIGGGSASNSNSAQISVRLPPAGGKRTSPDRVAAAARSAAEGIPGLRVSVRANRGQALSGTNPLEIIVRGRDYEAGLATSQELVSLMRENFPEITEPQMNISSSISELSVVVDRSRAADLGVSSETAAAELRATTAGAGAGVYREHGTEYPISVTLRPQDRASFPDLERVFVRNTAGDRIPIASFAELQRTESPVSIQREKGLRTIRVTASLAPGAAAVEVQPRLEAVIREKLHRQEGVTLEYAGEVSAIRKTGTQLGLLTVVVTGLVFAVMASVFESFIAPFIIFLTIPTMVIGVVFIYAVMGVPFSMFSLLGVVMLAGIVVNNGIVLVDYTNLLRIRGLKPREACIEAGRHRLRPILITTITTICGMVPLAFFPGEGARITQPIGITIVGGLSVGSLITLFFVPVLYSLISAKARIRRGDPAAE